MTLETKRVIIYQTRIIYANSYLLILISSWIISLGIPSQLPQQFNVF